MSEKGKLIFIKYRHLIFVILIVIIVIVLDIIFENYSKNEMKKIDKDIGKIYEALQNKGEKYDKDKLEKLSLSALNEWENNSNILSCFIEHDEIEKINVKLKLLNKKIKNETWGDVEMIIIETKEMVGYLEVKYEFSLENLF